MGEGHKIKPNFFTHTLQKHHLSNKSLFLLFQSEFRPEKKEGFHKGRQKYWQKRGGMDGVYFSRLARLDQEGAGRQ